MPDREESNVLVPPCALAALMTVAAREGQSRDEMVRRLLLAHVARQEDLPDGERLTHISTVLRYPGVARWNGDARWEWPRPKRLRLRVPAGTLDRLRAVSLQLPGQSPRAHRDYQARRLTDAVMTAIAVVEPFEDEFLRGLRPLLRHDAAVGLWRLAAAATTTAPELAVHAEADRAREAEEYARHREALLVDEILEDRPWHSPARFDAAAVLARELLTGPAADDNERMLHAQSADGWHERLQDLRHADEFVRAHYLGRSSSYTWAGRGASAVWRARRAVAMQDFEDWLVADQRSTRHHVRSPGWRVRMPAGWWAVHAGRWESPVPEPYRGWLDAGRLLAFPVGSRRVVWPLVDGITPVSEIAPLIAGARGIADRHISGFIEAVLLDWEHGAETLDDCSVPIALRLPAATAYELGLIDVVQYRELAAEAYAMSQQQRMAVIGQLAADQQGARAALDAALGNARMFARICRRYGIDPPQSARAVWTWPGRPLAGRATAAMPPGTVMVLAQHAFRARRRILGGLMYEAWKDGFFQPGVRAGAPLAGFDDE
ncbi:hypothetical protein [Micromonospora sp. NBS 11-29]|uniref:hypothetical protein n=1 Tax=Micromonospora sp. NBS 11-29 TaxID=1960879 RepID=UPI00111D0FE5|nr:hypothetical protein [Micromonospora sp. NBS 11-29]